FVIEHPRWIPPEELAQIDVRAGYNMGRIYRIYHKDRPPRQIQRLDKLDTAGLGAALNSPNGPQRDLAMEMLVWKQDKESVPLLEKLTRNKRPESRLHAICTLDGLKGLSEGIVKESFSDRHAGVRRHAIRVSEQFLSNSSSVREALE